MFFFDTSAGNDLSNTGNFSLEGGFKLSYLEDEVESFGMIHTSERNNIIEEGC